MCKCLELKLKQEKWRRNQAERESTSQRHELQNDMRNRQENLFSKLNTKPRRSLYQLFLKIMLIFKMTLVIFSKPESA